MTYREQLIESSRFYTIGGHQGDLSVYVCKNMYDALLSVFNDCGVKANHTRSINLKQLYDVSQKNRNGFVTISCLDNNFGSVLKVMLNSLRNGKYIIQNKMINNCTFNSDINRLFKWNGTKDINGRLILYSACLHVKQMESSDLHSDYLFLLGVNRQKQRYIAFRVVEDIENNKIW